MKTFFFRLFISLLFSLLIIFPIFGQKLACKKETFSALHPIPKIKYRCPANIDEYDEKLLAIPNRISVIKNYTNSLENFFPANWWQNSVDDLNVCDFKKKAGVLNKNEREDFENVYIPDLFGISEIRVIRVADPCYQTGFGGSNIFLLYRKNGKVTATEIIDGYFSRADAIFVDFAMNGNEQIIEVATSSGGLNPTVTNYYFTIDQKTNRAIPKNLFMGDSKRMTNQITSEMLMEDASEYGLPENSAEPLQIIKKGKLAKSFEVYNDTFEMTDNHKKFSKVTLRWNGKYYY